MAEIYLFFFVNLTVKIFSDGILLRYTYIHFIYFVGVGSCFDVEIPLRVKKMTTLKVEGKAVGEGEDGYTFSGKHRLQISQDLLVILVQSDKPIYKPGETGKAVLSFIYYYFFFLFFPDCA